MSILSPNSPQHEQKSQQNSSLNLSKGGLPKGWQENTLGELTSKIGSGSTPKGGQTSYKDSGISLIRSLNVHDDGFTRRKLAFIDNEQAEKLKNVVVEENDILLNITGASIARCCIAPNNYLPARVNQHVSIIRLKNGIMLSSFLHYALTSKTYKDAILGIGEQGATRQAITKSQIESFIIAYPRSLDEQKRIVAILDEAFAAISLAVANAEKNLANARELFESYLNNVFTHPSTSSGGKQGGALSPSKGDGWEEKKLEEVCAITSSLIDPRKDEFLDLIHVGAGNIESKTSALVALKTSREEELISGKFTFDESMVLYSKIRPYLMKVARPNFTGVCSADMYPLSPKASVITRDYLYYLLLSNDFTEYAIQGSARAGMPKVNRKHLFEYCVWLPDVKKQADITAKLDQLVVETKHLEVIYQQKLDALAELKQSILQKAFAGELS